MNIDPNTFGLVLIAIFNLITAVIAWQTKMYVAKASTVILELEKNTNSIKDALVAKTGEAAFAAGKDEARLEGEAKAAVLANATEEAAASPIPVSDEKTAAAVDRVVAAVEKSKKS